MKLGSVALFIVFLAVFSNNATAVGTVDGTFTATTGGAPISGATITLGVTTTSTDGAGAYILSAIPAATYPAITASAPGYTTGTFSNIVVSDNATTTQDFSLSTAPASACLIDTSQADFQTGVATNVDLAISPGDVTLVDAPVDQQNNTLGTQGAGQTATTWLGQTFTPAVSGSVKSVEVNLFSLNCGAVTMPNITAAIRNAAGNLPTGVDLATGTISGFCDGNGGWFKATFATPAAITAGTQYAIVLRPASAIPAGAPAPGYFFAVSVGTGATALQNPYAGGRRASSSNSGTTWAGAAGNANNDHGFRVYVDTGSAAGNLISSLKDSNPAVDYTATWQTLSWTDIAPPTSEVKFQVAGSNLASGPFIYVGPDGTGATFFSASGASLSQFNGNRYLQYQAYLSTLGTTAIPVLNEATVCYGNVCTPPPIPTITPSGPTSFCAGGSVILTSSSATDNQWYLNGNPIGGETGQQYVATASGDYTVVVAGTGSCSSSSTSAPTTITVNPVPATAVVTPAGPTALCTGGSVELSSSSATGNQWYLDGNPIGGATNQSYTASIAGAFTTIVTANSCSSANSSAENVVVNAIPATPTITPGGPTTFCAAGSVTLTSSSATGNQWYLNGNPIGGATSQTYIATASGDYTVYANTSGCTSAASAATTVTVLPTPAPPSVTPGGPTTFCAGGSVELNSSAATGNQWYLNGNPIGGASNQAYLATATGFYAVRSSANSCQSGDSAQSTITANPIPATPTITPGGPTTFCTGANVTLTLSSASGNQWYLDGNPIGGAVSQTYVATVAGDYTAIQNTNSCSSASTAATTITLTGPCAAVPGAPLSPAASGSNGQATITFLPPGSDGGSVITGYTVISNPLGGIDSNAGSTSLSHLVTGLTNGTTYTFTVTASNVQGDGNPSVSSNSVTILASQTLSFGTAPTVAVGGTGNVSATGGTSGNPVVLSSTTPSICTIVGGTVTGVSTGTCIIAADQAGNASYSAALQLTQSFSVGFPTTVTGNNPSGAGTITGSLSNLAGGCGFSTAQFIPLPNAALASKPANLNFPYGMINFAIAGTCGIGQTVNVTLTYPGNLPANAQFWKYGKTAANHTDHWYQLTLAGNLLVISGNTVSYVLTDGGNGDDDYTANGMIVDPAAIAVPGSAQAVASIPTMSIPGMAVLALLLAFATALAYRRDRK
ncbi:MAG: choice-of-anchor U domain-containing protein [Pseudomonadota bacterium]